MRRLLLVVSWVVKWVTRTPRRAVGMLAVPILLGVALAAGPMRDRPAATGQGDVLAGGQTIAPATGPTTPRSTVLPAPTGTITAAPTLPSFRLTEPQRAAAVGYVTTANSHDARPGKDRAFGDSYTRTRPYVTDALFKLITAENRRGDFEWSQWTKAEAQVSTQVVAAGVPDGAPAPTGTTAYARVEFRQVVTPTAGAGGPSTSTGALNLLVTKQGEQWLVSELLADT